MALLTNEQVANLNERGRYADGDGLYLQVASPTGKSWLFRYEFQGRERWMGLGRVKAFNVKEARARARKAHQQLADGIDPLEAKKQAKLARDLAAAKAITFEAAARKFHKEHSLTWRSNKHTAQFLTSLEQHVFPVIGHLPASKIDTPLMIRTLNNDDFWQTKSATAMKVRGRIEQVLDWAKVNGYREGENPARWKGNLRMALPAPRKVAKPKNFDALPFAEVPDFMAELAQRNSVIARALELLILTAARTGEIIGARWDEFDLTAKQPLWTIPAERMKGGREHRVPLSSRAVAILNALSTIREGERVFPGGARNNGISNVAMFSLVKRMRPPPEPQEGQPSSKGITVHGFRSAFRDWVSERTNFPHEVAEMALAHSIGNKAEAAYRRGDLMAKRAHLMEAWAKYCSTPVLEHGATVTPIRGRA